MSPEDLTKKYLTGDFMLKGEFQGSDYKREETLTRCERYAGWTLPCIFPDDPLNEYDEMQNDYQSVGAQAVNNLANKIMMALFQPSKPFFRMQLTAEQRAEVMETTGLESAEVDKALANAERQSMKDFYKRNSRTTLTDATINLIITGNYLLHDPKNGDMAGYSLRDYTILRDLRGNMVKTIVRETKAVVGLSDELAALAVAEGYHELDDVTLYTAIVRTGDNRYVVWQEMEDICYCHKQIGIYTKDTLEWIPLTWRLCRNKDYGTGLVEEYSGDFHTLSTLAEAMLDYTTVITDVKNLVDPTGMTDVRQITEAPSGAYVHGREEDLFVHAPQVANATEFLNSRFDATARRIGAAFLLNSAVTRDAERVTAEEIRQQAEELESSLGGVYSHLAHELQLPLAKRQMRALSPIFKDIEPVIVTGLESLSRNSDLANIRYFFQDLLALAEVPEQVAVRIDYGQLIAMLGAGHGVEYEKFLKEEDQVKEEQEQRAKANAAAQAQEAGAVAQAEEQAAPSQGQ
jgi:hypothetical protein